MHQMTGKNVFVTGAASGIGLAISKRCAGAGANVYCCDFNAELLTKEVKALQDKGLAVTPHVFDVTDNEACISAVQDCVQQFGGLDVLCNVAGMVQMKHFSDITVDEWRRIMDVNANSVFYLCKAAMPHLLSSGGNIVNIASTAGLVGLPYNAGYCASKGAVVQLTKALAVEYAKQGVRANAVCPGKVETPLNKNLSLPEDADMALFGRMHPLTQYAAEAEEIAAAVTYLASDEARFVTGSALVIDGGQTAV